MTSRFYTWRKSGLLRGRSSLIGYYVFPEQSNLPIPQAVARLVEDEPFQAFIETLGPSYLWPWEEPSEAAAQIASDTLLTSAFPERP